MLRFFRQIRKSLMEKNKTSTYILYAVGEITLVVIGILLALQINNWNEDQKAIDQEQRILNALIQETSRNSEIIQGCSTQIIRTIQAADKIRSYLSPDFPDVSIDSVNVWLGLTGSTERCIVSTDIIDELQSSGNLKNIRSVELRRQIGSWFSALEDLSKEEDEWVSEFSQEYIPYTNKRMAWDDVDHILNDDKTKYFPSRFDKDPRKMFQEFEYSNIFAIHYWRMNRVNTRIESLQLENTKLADQITQNLQSV